MLQQMRAFSKSWVASFFLLALALSFGVWGIADIFRGRVDTSVARIGSTEIAYDQFVRDYRNLITNQSQRLRQDITPDMARKMGLGDALLQDMINRYALDRVVGDLGLVASDADVAQSVHSMSAFYGPLGRFDRQAFESVLRQRNYGENEFLELIRAEMARAQLLSPVQGGFAMPPGYAHALFAYSTEKRGVEYIVVTPQALGAIAPPGEQVLAAYVKAHPARFSTPEYRSVSIASVGPDEISADLKVTDEQLRKEYNDKKAIYIIPEQRNVEQVTFPDEASAKAARAQIDGGKSFAEVARASGKTVEDRGSVLQGALGVLGAPAFALPEGGVTAPLKYFSSWVLLHVSKITQGKTTSFDAAKPDLVKAVTAQLAQAKIIEMTNIYQSEIGDGAEIAEAAKKAGLHYIHIAAVDAHGLAPDGSKTALPDDPDLRARLFDLEPDGEPSDPFASTGGHTYAVAVEGSTPPKMRSLDAVRAQATESWTKEQAAKMLEKRAAALATQAQREGGLKDIAAKLQAPVLTGGPLTRDGDSELFSPLLVDRLFSVPMNGVVSGPMSKGDAYIIARVSGVAHPPMPPSSQGYQMALRQLSNQVAGDITGSMAAEIRAEETVKINQKLFDQAIGNGVAGEGS